MTPPASFLHSFPKSLPYVPGAGRYGDVARSTEQAALHLRIPGHSTRQKIPHFILFAIGTVSNMN